MCARICKDALTFGVKVKKCSECEDKITRLCEVGGKVCTFHRFIEDPKVFLKINTLIRESDWRSLYERYKTEGLVPYYCSLEVVPRTVALIEYPDGSIGKVDPIEVCFINKE